MTREADMTLELRIVNHKLDGQRVLVRATVGLSSLSDTAEALERASDWILAWADDPRQPCGMTFGLHISGENDDEC